MSHSVSMHCVVTQSTGVQRLREEERERREYAVAAVSSAHTAELSRLQEEKEALSTQVRVTLFSHLLNPLWLPWFDHDSCSQRVALP